MGFIFIATINSYLMLDRMWHEDLVSNELMRDTNIALEKIIRGVRGNEGIEAAKDITSPLEGISSNTVQYVDYNDTPKSFYYSDGEVYAGGESILANAVSAAFYNIDDALLQIDLVAHKYILNKEIRFHLQTKVKWRN